MVRFVHNDRLVDVSTCRPSRLCRLLWVRVCYDNQRVYRLDHGSVLRQLAIRLVGTGNTHARRLLVEAAWHHRPRYHIGAVMRSRWDQAPAAARARGDEGNRRLHQRWVGFLERSKRPVIANVAISRELAGWCWSLAVMDC